MNDHIWLGSRESWDYVERLRVSAEANPQLFNNELSDENPVGLQLVGDKLAVISVSGPTISNSTFWSRIFGVPAYTDIAERLLEASDNSAVKAILIKLDTPGGDAKGVSKLSKLIAELSDKVKPIVTFNDGSMASAGLWYGTASTQVISDEDGMTGSLGAIAVHTEMSELRKKSGIVDTIIRSAPQKALATPYEPLSAEGRKTIEEAIDRYHNSFVKSVATNRQLEKAYVDSEIASGKMFTSKEALKLKLIDRVLPFEQVVARMLKGIDNTTVAKPRA